MDDALLNLLTEDVFTDAPEYASRVARIRQVVKDAASARNREQLIRAMAKRHYQIETEIEIDDAAKVSEGDDNGAYVESWVWVSFEGTNLDKRRRRRRLSAL